MKNNDDIFNRIYQKTQNYGLSFISSNGGTGKTTFFMFKFLRDALKKNITFHVFCRYANQMEKVAERWITSLDHYSARKKRLLYRLDIKKEDDKFIFIIEKDSGRKLAQILNVNGQAFYKQFGNLIGARRALFDEILAENGDYCPDEINKFNRLIFSMARSNPYQVIGLYNNTSPNFDYFKYYGGQSFSTHAAPSGALFVFFTANQYQTQSANALNSSVQNVIKNTEYNSVYNLNTFTHYPVFYKKANLKNTPVHFVLEIQNKLFKVRTCHGFIFFDSHNAHKSKKPRVSSNIFSRTEYPQIPAGVYSMLQEAKELAKIKTTEINDTVFVKIFCENV